MECFSSVTATSQSEPVLFAERLVDVCEQIQAWRNSRQNFQVYTYDGKGILIFEPYSKLRGGKAGGY